MERDLSGRAMLSAALRLNKTKKRIAELLPYGPAHVKVSPGELRKRLQRGDLNLAQVLQSMGPEAAIQLLIGARPTTPGPKSLEEFMKEDHGDTSTTATER